MNGNNYDKYEKINEENKEIKEEDVNDEDLDYILSDNEESLSDDKNISIYNSNHDSNHKDEFRSKILKLLGIVIVISLVIILLLFVLSVFFKKKYSYADIENILKESAVSYYKDNKSKLPANEDSPSIVESSSLISGEYMKEFGKYDSKFTSCKGSVTVKMEQGNYKYVPKLDCGKDYTTTSFIDKLKNDNGVVTSGFGLYNLNNNLVFRGSKVNNYIKIGDDTWRIVKVYSDNSMELIYNYVLNKTYWDNRYNFDLKTNSGIKQYELSHIQENLNDIYTKGYIYNNFKFILTDEEKKSFVKFDSCVGIRGEQDTSKDGSSECSILSKNQNISLLPVFDVLNASIDDNCTITTSGSCQNYNYILNFPRSWWLANSSDYKFDYAYVAGGSIYSTHLNTERYIKPVVHLSKDALYVSGMGTEKNPYKVR